MREPRFDPGLPAEILAALAIGILVLLSPLLRRWYRRWGATDAEVVQDLPGDELVLCPQITTTRGVTIRAPASDVWPWLVQIGQGRGGFYSYTRLENLVGCNMHNADRIVWEFQHLEPQDKIHLAPETSGAPYFQVAAIQPQQTLVLQGGGALPTAGIHSSWTFFLAEQPESTTRLVVRYRMRYKPGVFNWIIWQGIMDPIFFVMERRMLIGILQRAEASAAI